MPFNQVDGTLKSKEFIKTLRDNELLGRFVNPQARAQSDVSSRIPRSEQTEELKKFGVRVRNERLARALTQEELAEAAELAVRSLQKIEAGQINILITTARRLRRALGCPWERLLD